MKKILFIVVLSVAFTGLAQAQSWQPIDPGGSSSSKSDSGSSVHNRIGNFTYGTDGSRSHKIGNIRYHNDGSTTRRQGNTYYNSSGKTARQIGNATYGSDGKVCRTVGSVVVCN